MNLLCRTINDDRIDVFIESSSKLISIGELHRQDGWWYLNESIQSYESEEIALGMLIMSKCKTIAHEMMRCMTESRVSFNNEDICKIVEIAYEVMNKPKYDELITSIMLTFPEHIRPESPEGISSAINKWIESYVKMNKELKEELSDKE